MTGFSFSVYLQGTCIISTIEEGEKAKLFFFFLTYLLTKCPPMTGLWSFWMFHLKHFPPSDAPTSRADPRLTVFPMPFRVPGALSSSGWLALHRALGLDLGGCITQVCYDPTTPPTPRARADSLTWLFKDYSNDANREEQKRESLS